MFTKYNLYNKETFFLSTLFVIKQKSNIIITIDTIPDLKLKKKKKKTVPGY